MRKIHWSLRTPANVVQIVVWGGVAIALVVFTSPQPWFLVIVGGILGAVAGNMQALAIRSSAEALLKASTLLEVRSALLSTPSGKRYFRLFRGSHLLFAIVAFLQFRGNLLHPLLAGLFAFAFWREVASLSAVVALNRGAAPVS